MVTLVFGDNAYLRRAEIKKRVASFVSEYGEMGLSRFDGADLEQSALAESTQGGSLFASASLTVVTDASSNKDLHDLILQRVQEGNPDAQLILNEPSIDKRGTFYKELKKTAEVVECRQLDAFALGKWLVDEAKERNGEISKSDAQYLVQKAGEDQWRLSNELDKLISYNSKVSRDTIDELVQPEPRETIWELLDQAVQGKTKQAIDTYRSLRVAQMEPGYIMGMIVWQLHNVAVVVSAGNKSPEEVAKAAKMSPFVVKKLQSAVRGMTRTDLKQLLDLALKTDLDMKNGVDQDAALELFLLKSRATS